MTRRAAGVERGGKRRGGGGGGGDGGGRQWTSTLPWDATDVALLACRYMGLHATYTSAPAGSGALSIIDAASPQLLSN